MKNKNGADIEATNLKFDFKGDFSGNIGENGLFSRQNELVLTKKQNKKTKKNKKKHDFFFMPYSLDKISEKKVKNSTDIGAINRDTKRWADST